MSEQQTQREQFLRAIAATRKMVAKWPAWKRNALGPVPAAPKFPPVALHVAAGGGAEEGDEGAKSDTLAAPDGQETGSVEALQAQVAALTRERDEAGRVLRTLADTLHDLAKVIEEEVLK